jgi:hypothetical protein
MLGGFLNDPQPDLGLRRAHDNAASAGIDLVIVHSDPRHRDHAVS